MVTFVALLNADPLLDQHLVESKLLLVHVLSLAGVHSQLPDQLELYLLMLATLLPRDCPSL